MADFTRPTHRVETIIYIVARKVGGLPFACRRSWRVNRRSMKTVSKTNRAEGGWWFSLPVQPRCLRARMHARKTRAPVHESIIPKIASPVTSGFRPPLINKFRYRYRYPTRRHSTSGTFPKRPLQTIETLSALAILSISSNERFWLESFRTRVDVDANLSPRVGRGTANPPP